MDQKEALDIVGGLSNPSAMPCASYSLPASACKTGSQLRKIKGSVCEHCYAHRGFYCMPNVKKTLVKRLKAVRENLVAWTEAMKLLTRDKSGYFRWHDSGDIQSLAHLKAIVEIAKANPDIKYWLPTKEYAIVAEYIETEEMFPENLCVRVSSPMVDQPLLDFHGLPTTFSYSKNGKPMGVKCPASELDLPNCGKCRACWDTSIKLKCNKIY